MAKDSRMASIQLRDLSLDPDAINNKLAGSPLLVKECSIASLSAKIPWTFKNCVIEVEQLELVLVPFLGSNSPMDSCCKTDHGGKEKMCTSSDKIDPGTIPSTSGSVSLDVHEGVRTIAKSVKSFLTSFNVRVKNIIIQFDPCSALSEMRSAFHKSLVLRITEIEFGTCVSEDTATISSSKPDSLLGIEKITNFVKFKGAVIEFLQLDVVDKQTQVNSDLGTSFSQWNEESLPIGATSEILSGAGDGFSGKVNLSIPWKNGSLDIREVDADVSIEPVKLKLQPSTIEWVIVVWESLKNVGTAERSRGHYNSGPESSFPISKLHSQSSLVDPALLGSDTVTLTRGDFSKITSTMNNQETFPDSLSPRTHVIQNWVPPSRIEDERIHMDLDYGASIDQFFECFDELRSSQVSSGNSGIWNWTCSVFSAITVASNLASGSGHIPIEQHHVETSLRACIKEVSIILSFIDEEKKHSQDSVGNSSHNTVHGKNPGSFSASHLVNSLFDGQNSETYMSCLSFMNTEHMAATEFDPIDMNIQHLEASCQNAVVNLKICQQKMKFDASVMNVRIDEYNGSKNLDEGFDFTGCGNSTHPLVLNEQLQGQVKGVLPPFLYSATLHDSVMPDKENASRVPCSTSSRDGRVVLLESYGECSCQYAITYADTIGKPAISTSTSFSVRLPPLILWVHFPTLNVLLNLLKRLENHFDKTNISEDVAYDASPPEDVRGSDTTYITTVSSKSYLHGNIVVHQARIIVCFPSECHEDSKHSTNLDKFIVFEHSPSLAVGGKLSNAFPISKPTYLRDNSCTPSTSIHLSTGDFNLYLVDAASKNALANKPFSAIKVLSVISGKNDLCGITMLWQKGPVTGPWMVDRTWSLAASHGRGSRYKMNRDGCEFSSVTTAENHDQTSSHIRQELILSSSFFVHVHFSLVEFSLGNNDYKLFNQLLNQATEELSNRVHDTSIVTNGSIISGQSSSYDSSTSQTSVLVDCDVLDICISLDEELEVSNSMQKELPGSWNSLKLRIEKLELLSVIDIGEIKNAKFVWFNHGEGELWGSVFDRNEMAQNEDFLLLTCRNSSICRGAGEGANALSFGSAGTSITHLCNPQLSEIYTSMVVRCGTIVAPGGRTDWINAICLFFSSPPKYDQPGNNGTESKYSEDDPAYKVSFFLDLVDVAVSYEPHVRSPSDISQGSDSEYSGGVESHEETGERYFACLLAAASLSLSNHAIANSGTDIYNIQLQDVGLLISDLSGSKNGSDGHHAGYLQKAGYRKIAEEALIEAVLKIQDLHWEIESSDSHINLETCHDTTCGLLRLAAQLQQLFAPDMEDAVAHLQSRWNTIQQAHDGGTSNETTNLSDSSSLGSSLEMKLPVSEGDSRSVGLLDEILENAFYVNGKCGPLSDPGNMQSHFQQDEGMPVETCYNPGMGLLQKSTSDEMCADPFIESYYVSSRQNSSAPIGRSSFDATAQREIETGKSGWYKDDCFVIVENHISKGSSQSGGQQILREGKFLSSNCDSAEHHGEKGKIILKNTAVTWRMYAGLDWSELYRSSTRSSDSNGRDRNVCLELNLAGLNLQYDIYPEGVISVSKLSVSLQDIHLYDRSRDAPWMMVLGYYSSKEHPRGSHAKALNLVLEVVRPEPVTPLEDYRLHLELLPLRLHLHQRQLNFLIRFFGKDSFTEESPSLPNNLDASEMSARKKTFGSLAIDEEALLPFFQKCDIRPIIVRVDYIPGHIDLAALRRGNYAELLNLVSWKGIDLHLKDVCAVGVYGWSSVCETVVGEWLEDISHNQVHKLLKGLAPLRSLSAVSSGTSKLVSLPVRSYREDHRLLKGMQRGALAFVKSISLEAVGLGVHLAAGAHEMLLQAEYILTSIPPSVSSSEKRTRTARSIQPEDARQGIQQACESISEGLGRSGKTLLGGTLRAYQHGGGAGSALATAVRSVPAAAIAPISASARALHCALLGVRNSLDPERKKESMEKYLGPQGQKSGKKRLDS